MEDSPGSVREVGSHVQVAAVVEMVEVAKHNRKHINEQIIFLFWLKFL